MKPKLVHGLNEDQGFGLIVEKREVFYPHVCEQGCRGNLVC